MSKHIMRMLLIWLAIIASAPKRKLMDFLLLEIAQVDNLDSIVLSKGEFEGLLDEYLKNRTYFIYFLSKRTKTRFILSECNSTKNQTTVSIKSGKKKNKKKLTNSSPLDIQDIDFTNSSTKCLRVKTNGRWANLTPSAYLTNLDINLCNPPKLMYIGKSIEMKTRIENHEKIIQLMTSLNDNEEMILSFVIPNFAWIKRDQKVLEHFDFLNTKISGYKFEFDDMVKFTERALINLFKPELNSHFTKKDLSEDKVISKLKESYHLALSLNISGVNYGFWSNEKNNSTRLLLLDDDCNFKLIEEEDVANTVYSK